MISFIKDILARRFRPRTKTILWLLGCVLYVISPLDLISDLLIPLGFTDDAVVVAMTIKVLFDEFSRYKNSARTSTDIFCEK